MNNKQKYVIIGCTFIIGFMCIFPPWNFVHRSYPHIVEREAGYSFILTPPEALEYILITDNPYSKYAKEEGRIHTKVIEGKEYIVKGEEYLVSRIDFERLLVQSLAVIFLGFGVGIFLNLRKANIT